MTSTQATFSPDRPASPMPGDHPAPTPSPAEPAPALPALQAGGLAVAALAVVCATVVGWRWAARPARVGPITMGPGGWVSVKGARPPADPGARPWWAKLLRAYRV